MNESFPDNSETILNAVDPVGDTSEVALAHRLHVRRVRLVVGANHLVVEDIKKRFLQISWQIKFAYFLH